MLTTPHSTSFNIKTKINTHIVTTNIAFLLKNGMQPSKQVKTP